MQRYAMLRKKKKNAKNLNISAPILKFFLTLQKKLERNMEIFTLYTLIRTQSPMTWGQEACMAVIAFGIGSIFGIVWARMHEERD